MKTKIIARVPPRGVPTNATVGPVLSPGDADAPHQPKNIPSKPPRRLRRLKSVWADKGYARYYLTICVEGRHNVLANETIYQRFVSFLLDSPQRYHWWPKRFMLMPDHLHLIVHQGQAAITLGQWIKAMKALVGLSRFSGPSRQQGFCRPGAPTGRTAWHWQTGFFDHVLRSQKSEAEKWQYIYMNPVRAGLVNRPEDWPYGGEIVYDPAGRPKVIRGGLSLSDQNQGKQNES
jgi:putative transposase